jgi:heterodisulfide reductase subunit A
MDIRAYGKGFDRFVERARDQHKTRFICGRISSVETNPDNDNLIIQYVTSEGQVKSEEFDLLVLSVGLEPSTSSMDVARRLGIKLDTRGFIDVDTFHPVDTSNSGVFVCGSISGPKDIPESVMEASGAASAAASLLGGLEKKELKVEYPPEKDIRGEPPRVGVFVCRCGINIASTVDVPSVVEYVSKLPRVKHAQELLFACAQDSQKIIRTAIEEKKLNRIVVCACTPRTHEPLFQKTLRTAGLNPYLFEFANIREQCSWVHMHEPEAATEKAKDLARNAVSKVILAEPLYKKSLGVNKNALVIGGGLAGMTAALDLAKQGFKVYLVEKEKELGGNLRHIKRTLRGEDVGRYLEALRKEVSSNKNINLYLNTVIQEISGFVGNFKTTLNTGGERVNIEHGVVIVAAGGEEYKPKEYLYGQDERVITQRSFEEILETQGQSGLKSLKTVVMIQCVGSRDKERPYCSRVCCSSALKNAIRLKEINPKTAVYILYRDIRSYGLREKYYRIAREKGVIFIRYEAEEKPIVNISDGRLVVEVKDKILGRQLQIHPNLVVLSAGIVPNSENKLLSQFLKVPLDADGFFLEAHVKLRPVDFATDGVFVCGLSHYPKDIGETIAQARAAAGRAATLLCKDAIETEGKVAFVTETRCSGCGACTEVCAYKAIELDPVDRIARVNEALCKGCGTCAATCRADAVNLRGLRDDQILEAIKSF